MTRITAARFGIKGTPRLAWSVAPYMSSITIAAIRCVAWLADPDAHAAQQILEPPFSSMPIPRRRGWRRHKYIIPHDLRGERLRDAVRSPAPQDERVGCWERSRILPDTN
jgi:hypothetical protein